MSLPLFRRKLFLISTMSIANGQTDTPVLDADNYAQFDSLTIMAPAALTGTITVQYGTTDAASGVTWVTLQSPPGTDVTIAAGKAITIAPVTAPQFRIHSSGAEGAQRDFNVWGRYSTVTGV